MPAAYATWDPSFTNSRLTLSNGNLTVTPAADNIGGSTFSTISKSSGKWCWEVQVDLAGFADQGYIGISTTRTTTDAFYPGYSSSTSWSYYGFDGKKYNNGTGTAYGVTATAGDTISIALDLDNGKVWFAKNGTWMNSGDPAAGTNAAFTGLSGTFYAAVGGNSGGGSGTKPFITNTKFGAAGLTYGAPSGFGAGLFTGGTLFIPAPLSGLGTGGALITNRMA